MIGSSKKLELATIGPQLLGLAWFCIFVASAGAEPDTLQPGRILTSYALTAPAHQDPDNHDSSTPRDWRLLGSNDDGRTWQIIDARTNELFAENRLRRVFAVTNQQSFNVYRLEVTRTRDATDTASLAELELIGPVTGLTNETHLRMVISSSRAHPLRSPATQAFDGDPTTDWFDFGLGQAGGCWLQCQYTTNADIVVTNLEQLLLTGRGFSIHDSFAGQPSLARSNSTALTHGPIRRLLGYSLTSANDFYPRDPAAWQLLGSNDGGKNWDVLDERQNETFPRRLQKRDFALQKPAACALYRLQILSVFAPALANSVQLTEIEPHWAGGETMDGLTLIVSARGENPPWETIQRAFDKDLSTKWLDFSPESTNRASWVQWQFAAINGPPVLNSNRLSALRSQPINQVKLDLQAVVVGRAGESISLVDRSAFAEIHLTWAEDTGWPGDRVSLKGDLDFVNGKPLLQHPELSVLGRVPTVTPAQLGQSSEMNQDAVLGVIEGDAEFLARDEAYSTLRLTSAGTTNSVLARILNPDRRPLPNPSNCRLRVRGVVESVADERGRSIPGIVWVSRISDISLVVPQDSDWNQWPEYSLEELAGTNLNAPGLIRVTGTLDGQRAGRFVVLKEGMNRMVIYNREAGAWPPKSRIEAVGFFSRESSRTTLRWAVCRLAPEQARPAPIAVDADHPLTDIGEVNRLRHDRPDLGFPVRLRGVLTYICGSYIKDDNIFYLQDGTNAIQFLDATAAGLTAAAQQEGMYVEVAGQSSHDGIEPTSFVKFLGKGQMPEPIRNSPGAMISPQNAGRWAQFEGVVSGYNDGRLTLLVEGKELTVWVNQISPGDQWPVPGCRLRVSGVCDPIVNGRDQMLGARLLVPASEFIEVIKPAPAEPFLLPKVPIASVLLSSPGVSGGQMQMVRSEGIVTYKGPQMLCLQDKGSGMRVFLRRENTNLKPGDRVEVAGLALPDGFSPKLVQALVRRAGRGELPDANVTDFFQAYLQSSQDATRGQVDAIFEGLGAINSSLKLELRCEATKQDFYAYLPASTPLPPSLVPGARVRLRGVVKLQLEEPLDANQVVKAFEMYLNSPADIQVLAAPSWWTTRHTWWVLGALATVLILSLGWIGSLRSQVRRQTRALKQENAERKQAQTELAGANAALQKENLERKQTQEALSYERHLLECLLENSVDCIYFKDRESRFLRCSRSLRQRFDDDAPNLVGKTDFDLFTEEHARPAFEDEQEIIRTGRPLIGRVEREVGKNGRESWALTTKMPLQNQNGEIVGTFGISKDITAIKQAEAELENTHKKLVLASRLAGMADVATNVLHNVGNVLNSINVAATLVHHQVTKSRVADVRRLAKLLEEHAGDRAAFFTNDPKGRQVPDFIGHLADQLDAEQAEMLAELTSLRGNVEHVNQIIAMQQSYAQVSGVFENIAVTELLEDTLRMNEASLVRHNVKIVRDFGVLPPICTDKHKVLQILINLVHNAEHACDESGRSDKRITLHATNGQGHLKIAVIDNGIGIPTENLARIFNHGFTTRKGGHGFGLHSGALAARELGGSLTASSDGPGLGAVFTLDLPCQPSANDDPRDPTPPPAL